MIQKISFIMCSYMVLYSHCTGFRIPLNLQKLMELPSFIVCFDSFWRFWAVKSTWFKVFQEISKMFKKEKPLWFTKRCGGFFVKKACSRKRVGVFFPLVVSLDGRMKAVWFVEHFLLAQVGTSWCKSLCFSLIFCINPFTSLGFALQAMQIEEIGSVCFSYLKW